MIEFFFAFMVSFVSIIGTIAIFHTAYRCILGVVGEKSTLLGLLILVSVILVAMLVAIHYQKANASVLDGPPQNIVQEEEQRITLGEPAADEFGPEEDLGFWVSRGRLINVSDENLFETNMKEANLTWCDDAINKDTFPFTKSDPGTKEVFVIGRDGMVSYDMANNEMRRIFLRPATLQETLAFIRQYPQLPGTEMIALGQSCATKGGYWYPRYRVSSTGGALDVFRLEPGKPWYNVCFLAVRY